MRMIVKGAVIAAMMTAGPMVAQADDAPRVLRIGVVAAGGTSAIPGLPEIRRAYTQASGMPVRVYVAPDAARLIEAQAKGRVHYAIYSSAAYATAAASCECVEPLAAPVGAAGDVGLQAVIYARRGSAAAMEDAARLRVVSGPVQAVGPQLLAMEALAAAGAGDDVMFAADFASAEQAFAEGGADVLVGWEAASSVEGMSRHGTRERIATLGVGEDEIVELWRSGVVRYGPHAVRTDMPAELKASLRTFLLHVHAQQPAVYDRLEAHHLGGFRQVSEADYAEAARMVLLAAE
jgi:phosphonate transport system substrate-binding protein